MIEYENRYGDHYTFTLDDEGNILWEGKFEWCRFGMPNDYTKAYKAYREDFGPLTLEEFKVQVFKYDDEKQDYVMEIKYRMLVESSKDEIDMVDPSGGPYISRGYNMEYFGPEFKGMIVKDFKRIDTGYKIIIK